VSIQTSALLFAILVSACSRPTTPTTPTGPSQPSTARNTVQSITDGDTLRLASEIMGTSRVRLVNIDAPELGGASQEPWAAASRDALRALLPAGTEVSVITDRQPLDSFGRLLGIVIRQDGIDVNYEQLRLGHAVTYFIWPNRDRLLSYRAAQIEAQDGARGIWGSPALRELPFEYRLRIDNERPFRPVGDALTSRYVEAGDYPRVHVNNRLFFGSVFDAQAAGYLACPRDGPDYAAGCFAPGR
jgi:endonuclease YncB( thermonuclease family)